MSDEYSVGHGKPPLETRFRPGRSGNPGGRPRGKRNLKTDLDEELQQLVSIGDDEHNEKISKQRLIVKKLVDLAISGDARAMNAIIILCMRHDEVTTQEHDTLAPSDVQIVRAVKKRSRSSDTNSEPNDA